LAKDVLKNLDDKKEFSNKGYHVIGKKNKEASKEKKKKHHHSAKGKKK